MKKSVAPRGGPAEEEMKVPVTGADGVIRQQSEEARLNQMMAHLFRGRLGKEAIAYLRSITLDTAAGPGVDTSALLHYEGQRYIVGVILERIERAKTPNRSGVQRRPRFSFSNRRKTNENPTV